MVSLVLELVLDVPRLWLWTLRSSSENALVERIEVIRVLNACDLVALEVAAVTPYGRNGILVRFLLKADRLVRFLRMKVVLMISLVHSLDTFEVLQLILHGIDAVLVHLLLISLLHHICSQFVILRRIRPDVGLRCLNLLGRDVGVWGLQAQLLLLLDGVRLDCEVLRTVALLSQDRLLRQLQRLWGRFEPRKSEVFFDLRAAVPPLLNLIMVHLCNLPELLVIFPSIFLTEKQDVPQFFARQMRMR